MRARVDMFTDDENSRPKIMILNKDEVSGLRISGTLDIDAADSLRDALLDCFLHQTEIIVDLGGVDGCDASALQVLLAARGDAASAGKAFRFNGVSNAVSGMAAALGISVSEENYHAN
jgi:anti-anti-sigma factor